MSRHVRATSRLLLASACLAHPRWVSPSRYWQRHRPTDASVDWSPDRARSKGRAFSCMVAPGRPRRNWRDDPPAARPTHAMRRTTRRDRKGDALRWPCAETQASNEGARLEADAMANPARRLGAIPSRYAL